MRVDTATFAAKNLAKSKLPRYTIEMAFRENVNTGTAQAGAATTITLVATAAGADNYYTNMVIEITGGTGIGQKRTITAYVGATKVATVATWTTNPDATSVYRIDDLYYLTSHALVDSAIVAGAPVTYNVIEKLSGTSQQIFPDEGRATIGAISFSVVDKSSSVTSTIYSKLSSGYGLKGKRVRFYLGYDGLAWTDYCLIQTQIVDSISFNADGSYAIQCADVNRSVRTDIFDPKTTTLSKSIDSVQLLIPVYSVTGFSVIAHGASYSDAPNTSVGYIQVEKEVIRWKSTTTDATLGLCFVADQRGALNTLPIAHQINTTAPTTRTTKVSEYFYLEMPGPKLAYAILTGVLYGQGASLPSNWCIGISTNYVRLSDFTGIGNDWWTTSTDIGLPLRFEALKKQDGKKFLEKELYMLMGAFSPIYSTGELGLRRMTKIVQGSSYVDTLDSTNVVAWTSLKHDMMAIRNQIEINWNWDALLQKFTRTDLLIDATSINVHGASRLYTFDFLGLHGSIHSTATLKNRFDAYRDRYAGPPQKFDATLLPSKNVLEVGDIVRVQPPTMRDYVTGTTFNRSMEVQAVKIDWITGKITASLFGSSSTASASSQSGTTVPPLNDTWYTSAGTSLVTYLAANYPAAYTDSGTLLTITGNVTLPGNAALANAIYYYNGDITINAAIVVTINQNVEIRHKGFLTINGKINGKGLGLPGSASASISVPGQIGYIGTTKGTQPVIPNSVTYLVGNVAVTVGLNISVPPLDLYTTGGVLAGLPTDIRGTSGGTGSTVSLTQGGAGGAGGAGLLLIGRGLSFGASGLIDLSGADGSAGTANVYGDGSIIYSGSGSGGAPGALIVLLDGSNAVVPDLGAPLISQYGLIPLPVAGPPTPGLSGFDMGEAAYRVQYLPANSAASSDINQPLPDVTGFSAAQNGGVVVFKWTQVIDTRLIGYDIRYAKQGETNWNAAISLTQATRGTQITSAAVPPGTWTAFIKALDINGTYSVNAATYNLIVSNVFNIINQANQAPNWNGVIGGIGDAILMEDGFHILTENLGFFLQETAISTLVPHWTGVLVPNSLDAASVSTTFDTCVPNPVASCTYQAVEIDAGFDGAVRIWGSIRDHLGPGQTGSTDVALSIDYHLTVGAYDGWEPWIIGNKTTRYVTEQISFNTANGVLVLDDFIPTVDVQERTETFSDQIIAAGGTVITFAAPFHITPNVVVTAKGGAALIGTYDTPTTTNVKVHVFNSGGSDVGGTANLKATGA